MKVQGIPEVQEAYRDIGRNFDSVKAAANAAEEILPDVRRLTRRQTGALQEGWNVEANDDTASFLNSQFYMVYQEFGTEDIEPTLAVFRAWEANEEQVVASVSDDFEKAAENAGWQQ